MDESARQALDRLDAPFLAQGLIPNSRSMAAHTRRTALLLKDRAAPSPCSLAIAHITHLFERSIPESARALLACAKGCAFCCHQPVIVNAPEAFFVAAALHARPDTAAAVDAAAMLLAHRNADAPRVGWIGCPLLSDNICSVYAVRPLSCHGYVSVDVEDCKTGYSQPGDAVVRAPAAYNDLRHVCRRILLTALRASGLPDACYEMNAAVSRVLQTEQAERRWLDGEDIFAGLAVVAPLSPDADSAIARMAATIAPTLEG